MISLIRPPRRVELARLKIAAEASTQSFQAQVRDIRTRANSLRTDGLKDVIQQHPFATVGVAAGVGFVSYYLIKSGGISLATLTVLQTVGAQVYSALKS